MESKPTDRGTALPPAKHDPEHEVSILAAYSGPLPPASEFAAYERAVPGAGKIILEAFVAESEHRRGMERRTLMANVASDRIGALTSTILTLSLVGVGAWLIYSGKEISGLIALVSVVGLRFWVSRNPTNDDNSGKDQ